MSNEPLVSLVTPVHNTEEYLADCIKSVLAQSYQNWEYIIVINGCIDRSPEIAQFYSAQDPRIRVVNTDMLLPQTVNYNFALRQISRESRYCKMVQADDGIFPTCVTEMVDLAETDASVAIVGAYQLAGSHVKCQGLTCAGPRQLTTIVSGSDACRLYFLNRRYLFGTPTSLLYRSDLVRSRNPFFIESSYYEDSELCFDVLDRHNFGFVHRVLTYTRTSNDSISTTAEKFNPDILHAYIIITKYGQRYLTPEEYKQCHKRVEHEYYSFLAYNMFQGLGKEFWDYHLKGLELSGLELDRMRLYRMQVGRALNMLGNPKMACTGLLHRLRQALSDESGKKPRLELMHCSFGLRPSLLRVQYSKSSQNNHNIGLE